MLPASDGATGSRRNVRGRRRSERGHARTNVQIENIRGQILMLLLAGHSAHLERLCKESALVSDGEKAC